MRYVKYDTDLRKLNEISHEPKKNNYSRIGERDLWKINKKNVEGSWSLKSKAYAHASRFIDKQKIK